MALIVRKGYPQVEGNLLSGITYGGIVSQVPISETTQTELGGLIPNGLFLVYDVLRNVLEIPKNVSASFITAVGGEQNLELLLVYNETHQPDQRLGYSDFVFDFSKKLSKKDTVRALKTLNGGVDVFTTNHVDGDFSAISVGDILYVNENGVITSSAVNTYKPRFIVTKKGTMPDGQPGLELTRAI